MDYAKDEAQEGVGDMAGSRWRAAWAVLSAAVFILFGVLTLAGVDLPFADAFTAVVLILSGLFLLGTVVVARRRSTDEETPEHRGSAAGDR